MTEICKCPNCGEMVSVDLCDCQDLVTYWGEDPPEELTCEHCERNFKVQENVTRWWEVAE